MSSSSLPESELLKKILKPLLEDFQYWFGRARSLLETQEVSFLERGQQADLLAQVARSQEEVQAAQSLFGALEGQVAIEPTMVMSWHQKVTECWQLLIQWRLSESPDPESSGWVLGTEPEKLEEDNC